MLIGLVGKPSCGKSTFFKAATLANVLIADYPFATIKPNHGIGHVKVDCLCKDFKVKCNPQKGYCVDGQRFVPVELMDVAGLVEGASEGKGMGNQFLDDLRQADAFIHIVDVSGETDEKGEKTTGHDPVEDIEMLEKELNLWYLGIMKKVWRSFARTLQIEKGDFSKAVAKQFSGLKVTEDDVKDVVRNLGYDTINPAGWSEKQLNNFAVGLRRKTKPMIIAANKVDLPDGKKNYEKLRADYPNLNIIPCSADSELALREASKAGLIKYIPGERDFALKSVPHQVSPEEGGASSSSSPRDISGEMSTKGKIIGELSGKQKEALDKIKKDVLNNYVGGTGVQSILNNLVFGMLKYIAVFPAGANKLGDSKGNILPDCFLVPEGSTALDFAYIIHSDLGDKFIKAINAKTKQAVGKEYKVQHRDGLEVITR